MTAINVDYTASVDPHVEIARLRIALRVERERRVMSVLWGARDEDCPRAFSLYCHEDPDPTHADDPDVGVVAHGVVWPDGYTVLRSRIHNDLRVWLSYDDMMTACVLNTEGRVSIVWLSEDIGDLTDAITDDVRRKHLELLRSEDARHRVALAIAAVPWNEPQRIADAAIAAMFPAVDGP